MRRAARQARIVRFSSASRPTFPFLPIMTATARPTLQFIGRQTAAGMF